jgi:glycosyltransferase involved in cell wall biosynthesis
MRILIISQYFWPENFRINDLAIGLKELGHEVTILTGKPNYPGGSFYTGYGFFRKYREDFHGMDLIRVPLIPRGEGGKVRLILNYFSFALFACLLAPFYCRGKYDLIFVCQLSPVTVGLPALLLKKIKKIPIMFWVQDLWPESLSATGAINSKLILRLVKSMVRFIYEGCDNILVQSRAFNPSIEKLGVDGKRILYFPNSAEELYQPAAAGADLPQLTGIPAGFRIMFAGNIGAAQDFPTIIEAASLLKDYPDIHWLIVGDGRMLPWVKNEVLKRHLEDRVHFLGRHPVELMPAFFSWAQVMLVTLKKEPIFALTIPAKIQSYLACARPIIAALDGEGARTVVEAQAGIACAAESPEELAKAVLLMYKTPEAELEIMGRSGREYFARNFERSLLLKQLDGWIMTQRRDHENPHPGRRRHDWASSFPAPEPAS